MLLIVENRRNRRETCPSATLSTTNPTCTDLGSNVTVEGRVPVVCRLAQPLINHLQDYMASQHDEKLKTLSPLSFVLAPSLLQQFYRPWPT